jgi:hypothetical protein
MALDRLYSIRRAREPEEKAERPTASIQSLHTERIMNARPIMHRVYM